MRSKILSAGILIGVLTGCSSAGSSDTEPLPLNYSTPVISPVSPAPVAPPPTLSTIASIDDGAGSTDEALAPIASKCLKYMAPVREYYRSSAAERAKPERIDAVKVLLSSATQYCTSEEYVRYLEAVKAETGA